MNNDEKVIQDSNIEIIRRKRLIKTVFIVLVVYILILALYRYYLYKIEQQKNAEHQQKIAECQAKATEYLQEKYQEEFDIKYNSEYSRLNSTGNYKNYVYSFVSKNNPELGEFYVRCEYSQDAVTHQEYEKIKERVVLSRGMFDSTLSSSYESKINRTAYYEKSDIERDLQKILENSYELKSAIENAYGRIYTIDINSKVEYIDVRINRLLNEDVENNFEDFSKLFNNIVNLLVDKHISVNLIYQDYSISIAPNSNLENNYIINDILKSK